MRKSVMLLIVLMIITCSGCVTVRVKTKDGAEASYTRVGNQEIGKITYSPETNSFTIENQKSDNAAAFETVSKAIDKIPVP